MCTRGSFNKDYASLATFATQISTSSQFIDMDVPIVNMDTDILTLPWETTYNWGQLTLSQDKCAVTIAGIDTGIRSKTGALSGLDYTTPYSVSVARIGGNGWKNFKAAYPTAEAYDHWMPTGSGMLISDIAGAVISFSSATTLSVSSVEMIPTSAALSGYMTPSKNYYSRVYVATSEVANSACATADTTGCTVFSTGLTSSLYGRCWYPRDAAAGAAGGVCGSTAAFETVDPYNTDGTGGMCYLSTSDATSVNSLFLQVRALVSYAPPPPPLFSHIPFSPSLSPFFPSAGTQDLLERHLLVAINGHLGNPLQQPLCQIHKLRRLQLLPFNIRHRQLNHLGGQARQLRGRFG
jgi:hypothetical protein